jgi:chemotaxis signal transduction protein
VTTTAVAGYVLFRLGERRFAAPLDEIREIVRLAGLETLPGAQPPLAGVINLRGVPLPVLDIRGDGTRTAGDVLVMTLDGDPVGVAVDEVCAVLAPEDLPDGEPPSKTLPSYVVGVRHHAGNPVLLVDLQGMI